MDVSEDIIYGRVSAVYLDYPGTSMTADAAAGVSTLTVENTLDFDENGGTALVHADDSHAQETVTYTSITDTTLVLSGVTSLAHDDGSFISPDSAGTAQIRRAIITREGYDDGDIDCRVPYRWHDVMTEGTRDTSTGAGEAVAVKFDGQEYVLFDVLGQELSVDGSSIDGSTITGVTSTPSTDGNPPASSPSLASGVIGGPTYFALHWTAVANADPLWYDIYVSATNGFTPGVTADALTPVLTIQAGTAAIVKTKTDATAFAYATSYYFKIIARDADGSASAGTQGTAQMVQIDGGADILARSIVAGDILAGTVTANEMLAGTITATSGIINDIDASVITAGTLMAGTAGAARNELDKDGYRLYSSDGVTKLVLLPTNVDGGSLSAYFQGTIQASAANLSGLVVNSSAQLSAAATLTLSAGVVPSLNSPTVSMFWDFVTLGTGTGGNHQGLGIDTVHSPNRLVMVNTTSNSIKVFNASDGSVITQGSVANSRTGIGATVISVGGTPYIYVLCIDGSTWRVQQYDMTVALQSETTITGLTKAANGCIGTDGTDLYIAEVTSTSSGTLTFRKFTLVAGVPPGTPTSSTSSSGTGNPTFSSSVNLTGFTGYTDNGTSRWMVSESTQHATVYCFTTAGVYAQNRDFKSGSSGSSTSAPYGVSNDGTYAWTIPQTTIAVKHSLWDWTTASSKYWASFAYRTRNALRTVNQADMETNTTGFQKIKGTETFTGADTTHGAATAADSAGLAALKVVTAATSGSGVSIGTTGVITDMAPAAPGGIYSGSCYVWGNAGTEALEILLVFCDSTGAILSSSSSTTFTATTAWAQYKVENKTAPASTAYVAMYIRNTTATAVTFWVDAAQIEDAAAATAWVSPAETIISPRASLTMVRRAKLLVTFTGSIPSGADRQRVYLQLGSSDPGGGAGSDLQYASSTSVGTASGSASVANFVTYLPASPAAGLGSFSSTAGLIEPGSTDTSGTPYWKISGAGTIRFLGPTMQNQYWLYEEFTAIDAALNSNLIGMSGMAFVATSAGSTAPSGSGGVSAIDHPGVGHLDTGNGATAKATFRTATSFIKVGLAKIRCSALVRIPTLSDGTNTFFVGFGLADAANTVGLTSVSGNHSIMFRYTHGTNSGKFQILNSNASGVQATDTGVTVVANQWYFLEFEVSADNTTISWWIDGGSSGSGTVTMTNAPATTAPMAFFMTIQKSASTTARQFEIDSCSLYGSFVD